MRYKKSVVWVLEKDPVDVPITTLYNSVAHVDFDKVKRNRIIKGDNITCMGEKSLGKLLYGVYLGGPTALKEQGNDYYTNDTILEAIGYVKHILDVT